MIFLAQCTGHIVHTLPTLPVWSAFCYSNRCLKYQLTKREGLFGLTVFECCSQSILPIAFRPVARQGIMAGVWSGAKALSSWPGIRERGLVFHSPLRGHATVP